MIGFVTLEEFDTFVSDRGITLTNEPSQLLTRALDFMNSLRLSLPEETPQNVKDAQMLIAVEIDKENGLMLGTVDNSIASEKVSSLQINYFEGKEQTDWRSRNPVIYGLLSPYLPIVSMFGKVRRGF